MDLKELFKNKFKFLNEDNKNMTHAELYKHHKDLEESKWKEVGEIESKKDEINKQYIQAVKDGDKEAAEKLKQQFYDLDNKAVNTASEAREHHSNATSVHLSAQQSGNYNPKDFDYNPNSIKQPEPAKAEAPKTNNAEPTSDATAKTANSTNEPSALDHAKPQTKAPTEFKKAETATEKQPEQTNTEIKTPKDNEPSVLKGAKEYDGKNPVVAPKPEAPKQQASNSEELAKNTKQAEAPKQEVAPKATEPNHPNIQKPVDAQPAPVQQPVQPAPVQQPAQPAPVQQPVQPAPVQQPTQPQVANQPTQVANQQPAQPAPVNQYPSAPGTVAAPQHSNIVKPTDAQPAPVQQPTINNMPKDNSHLTGGTKQLDQSNPLNSNSLNNHGGTGITTNQPPIIPSSGQQVHDVTQHASNPVDHWANFKQSSHDAYGHLKNFVGQHYQNIKQNLGQHYQNIKQNAHEHLSNAKQFATDHAHEIAGAGALGAAGLAAYAAYKHFKNKKKQPAPQPHH